MIELAPKNLCSGCAACRAVCPKGAIDFVADAEGFSYPKIDAMRCVSCGKCRAACPVLNRDLPREPQAVFAAVANDVEIRDQSSSGGMFTLLARNILAKGGVVFGAAWDCVTHTVRMVAARSEQELAGLCGSKYVQAEVGNVYQEVLRELNAGCDVLFSGTPCQIAALNRVIGEKKNEHLLTVEVVCHAVPSPLAFKKYASWREQVVKHKISRISSRSKNCSGRRYAMSLSFHDTDIAYLASQKEDSFLRGFLSELFSRPSCHACSMRELRSGADLSIADYWGAEEKFPDMNAAKWVSLVLVNTPRGANAFDEVMPLCCVHKSDFADARRANPTIFRSMAPHPQRERFFQLLSKSDNFDALVMRVLPPRFKIRLRYYLGCLRGGFGLKKVKS